MGPEREGKNLLSLPENSLNFYSKTVEFDENKKKKKINADFKSLSSLEPLHPPKSWNEMGIPREGFRT